MADRPKRYRWLVLLILGLMALGMAIKALRAEPEARETRGVAAPVPPGVTRTFGELDDGGTASVAVEERFAVVLSSWAEWRLEEMPSFLRHVETRTGPAGDSAAAGADQWQVTVFDAVEAGEGHLRLVLGRPWDEDDSLREYRLTVKAQAQPGR